MKIKILHLVVPFFFLGLLPFKTVALNYTITFTGTGASSTVDRVIVQNLTRGTSVIVPTGNVLNLLDVATAVNQLGANNETIRVYPASVAGKYKVSFYARQAGTTQLNAFSLDGRKVAALSTDLQAGNNTFELSLPGGVYVIQVTGNEYAYTAKLLSPTGTQGTSGIVYSGAEKPVSQGPQKVKSSRLDATTMSYTAGDQLLYKAVSGNYSNIVTDVPTGDKTTNFNFAACTDGDGNNYTTVTIGPQTWMAENLNTTQYNDNTPIPLTSDNTAWVNLTTPGYCWYNNDADTYKSTYGALYNWYTVSTGKLAPTGWHVSTDAEWTALQNYLIANGYNFDGSTSGDYYDKSLAAATNWATSTSTGSIGNDLSINNRTGFSALPGGFRNNSSFFTTGYYGFWWSSVESNTSTAWYRVMSNDDTGLYPDETIKNNGFSIRCVRDILSTLTTTGVSSVTVSKATSGGNITDDGGATITARGVCWSTSANPTIADSKTMDGTGAGSFTSALTGLSINTTYNIRAYATNSAGTAYGNQVSFTTDNGKTITDVDGNVYSIVTIGTQTWMAENLKTTQYNDGTAIPLVTDNTAWGNLTTPGYCWYNNDADTYKSTYGALYNWYTVSTGKLAPTGWHVSTDAEWTTLQNYLIANGYNFDGSTSGDYYDKSLAATTNWATCAIAGTIGDDLSTNNRTGFSALPGGFRNSSNFFKTGYYGFWWSSVESDTFTAWYRFMGYDVTGLYQYDTSKNYGLSIRCVRDVLSTLTTTGISSVTVSKATSGGNITDDGGATITARGVCWSTSANPTIADLKTMDGTGAGSFTSALAGLSANTTYNVRAYATNSVGTTYGNQVSFTTDNGKTFTDVDGNVYRIVTIGTQAWMAENLKTTQYNDGTAIPLVTDNTTWRNLTTPGYCWYNNDANTNKVKYGALYNWYTINTGKLAPTGWHVPDDDEWATLEDYLTSNGYNYDGSTSGNYYAKSLADSTNWNASTISGSIGNDLSKNNSTGFSALPGGYRGFNGFYNNATYQGHWWSYSGNGANYIWNRYLNDNACSMGRDADHKDNGYSVRCIRDN